MFLPLFIVFWYLARSSAGSRRRLKLRHSTYSDAEMQTLRLTALIMWILFAAHAFSTAYTTLGASELMNHMMSLIPGGQWGALVFMLLVLPLLGMVLDPVGIILITCRSSCQWCSPMDGIQSGSE